VRGALADHPDEKMISLLAIAVSNLETHPIVQLELPLGLGDEGCRPGTKKAQQSSSGVPLRLPKQEGGSSVPSSRDFKTLVHTWSICSRR
jgi:hypothetical protein